jgi:hypothetical protein
VEDRCQDCEGTMAKKVYSKTVAQGVKIIHRASFLQTNVEVGMETIVQNTSDPSEVFRLCRIGEFHDTGSRKNNTAHIGDKAGKGMRFGVSSETKNFWTRWICEM